MDAVGKKVWAIAEGYIPATSVSDDPALLSHETACMLNTAEVDAHVTITVYFTNRGPAGPYLVTVPAQRTVPRGISYASVIQSDVPIVVQHTRLDSRNPAIALLTTIAFSA